MAEHDGAVRNWCSNYHGQNPVEISLWTDEKDLLQLLIRLENKVMIADLEWDGEEIRENGSLSIPIDGWSPGSIQTRRMPDGLVRFRHRNSEIMLAAKVRAPEWASALLEKWLLSMRGDSNQPRDRRRRVSDIKRNRETVTRMLEQASMGTIHEGVSQVQTKISGIDNRLIGRQ
jgi:hypothetical protein